VTCVACHTSLKARRSGERLSFAGLSVACDSCHRDVHAGQFIREGKTTCERCHEGPTWRNTLRFDHNRDSAYALDGAHSRTPCLGCHKVEMSNGIALTRYKPLGKACADCHTGRKS
jgi:hypothetical protein